MTRMVLTALALLLATSPVVSLATKPAGKVLQLKPAPTPKAISLGYELASVTNGEALTRTQLDKVFRETFPKQLAANPQFVEIENMYPGFSAQLVDRIGRIITDAIDCYLRERPEAERKMVDDLAGRRTRGQRG